jgi:RNA polymerase sigma factor (sigma-70 family)
MPSQGGSVSGWISQLKVGDEAAAQRLWERYFGRLVRLVRARRGSTIAPGTDAEDVALSTFATFCQGMQRGRFPQLGDRNDLWRLLVVLTVRKLWHCRRDARSDKRGGGLTHGPATEQDLEEIASREPTPEFAAEVAEQVSRRLASLDTAELRTIAMRKLEGYTTEEIAAQLGCARSTIERRLRLIRLHWTEEPPP